MKFLKWGFVYSLCAAFVFTVGAVELGRNHNHPRERISGKIIAKFVFFVFFAICSIRLVEFTIFQVQLI